jgi:hypothetical protein
VKAQDVNWAVVAVDDAARARFPGVDGHAERAGGHVAAGQLVPQVREGAHGAGLAGAGGADQDVNRPGAGEDPVHGAGLVIAQPGRPRAACPCRTGRDLQVGVDAGPAGQGAELGWSAAERGSRRAGVRCRT